MAYVSTIVSPRDLLFPHDAPARPRRGLFGRMLAAMIRARQIQVEREIARYLAGSGGKFTDEAEREIERRFLSSASDW